MKAAGYFQFFYHFLFLALLQTKAKFSLLFKNLCYEKRDYIKRIKKEGSRCKSTNNGRGVSLNHSLCGMAGRVM